MSAVASAIGVARPHLSDQRNTRWCSDALEIGCDNGEKVRVAFALDCCDREAMGHVATIGGITAEDVQDLMVATIEHRYGPVNHLPVPIEWLSDNGSCYTARDTPAPSPARSAWCRAPPRSAVPNPMAWRRRSSARSNATMFA